MNKVKIWKTSFLQVSRKLWKSLMEHFITIVWVLYNNFLDILNWFIKKIINQENMGLIMY